MRMLWLVLTPIKAAAGVGIGFYLSQRYAPSVAVAVSSGIALVAVLIGCVLLKTSTISKITWKNQVAGFLMPWGWKFSNGQLPRAAVACTIIWTILAGVGVLLQHSITGRFPAAAGAAPPWTTYVLFAFWLIDGAAFVYTLGQWVRNFGLASHGGRSLLKVILFITLLLVLSAVCYFTGHPYLALLIAGGPPSALGAFFGGFVMLFVLGGKKMRWN
ncbi:MAG: hypothetical protein QM770_06475 [Tepidisphaeraceae bacterium]